MGTEMAVSDPTCIHPSSEISFMVLQIRLYLSVMGLISQYARACITLLYYMLKISIIIFFPMQFFYSKYSDKVCCLSSIDRFLTIWDIICFYKFIYLNYGRNTFVKIQSNFENYFPPYFPYCEITINFMVFVLCFSAEPIT